LEPITVIIDLFDIAAMSLKRVALLRRQERLPVDRLSIKDEVLSISGGHVIRSDVTSARVVGWSR